MDSVTETDESEKMQKTRIAVRCGPVLARREGGEGNEKGESFEGDLK